MIVPTVPVNINEFLRKDYALCQAIPDDIDLGDYSFVVIPQFVVGEKDRGFLELSKKGIEHSSFTVSSETFNTEINRVFVSYEDCWKKACEDANNVSNVAIELIKSPKWWKVLVKPR